MKLPWGNDWGGVVESRAHINFVQARTTLWKPAVVKAPSVATYPALLSRYLAASYLYVVCLAALQAGIE